MLNQVFAHETASTEEQGSISPTYLRIAFGRADSKSVKSLTTWLSFYAFGLRTSKCGTLNVGFTSRVVNSDSKILSYYYFYQGCEIVCNSEIHLVQQL